MSAVHRLDHPETSNSIRRMSAVPASHHFDGTHPAPDDQRHGPALAEDDVPQERQTPMAAPTEAVPGRVAALIKDFTALPLIVKVGGGAAIGLVLTLMAASALHHPGPRQLNVPGQEVGVAGSPSPASHAVRRQPPAGTAIPTKTAPVPGGSPKAASHQPMVAPASSASAGNSDLAEMQALGHHDDHTTKVTAAMPASPASSVPPVAVIVPAAAPAVTAVTPADPVKVAQLLQAAPLSSTQQIDTLELVTGVARAVSNMRGEVAQLHDQITAEEKADQTTIEALQKRLATLEARQSVADANAALPTPDERAHAAALAAREALARVDAPQSQAIPPVTATARPTVAAGPVWTPHYRILAASPQLAMIEDTAAPGGSSHQYEVGVGTAIPHLGAVLSISQRGAAWVIHTAHGDLQ